MEYLHAMSQDEQVWTRASFTENSAVPVTSTSLLTPVLGRLPQKQFLNHQLTLMSRAFLPPWSPKHFPLLCSLPTSAHSRVFPNPNHLNHDQAQVLGGEWHVPSVFVKEMTRKHSFWAGELFRFWSSVLGSKEFTSNWSGKMKWVTPSKKTNLCVKFLDYLPQIFQHFGVP